MGGYNGEVGRGTIWEDGDAAVEEGVVGEADRVFVLVQVKGDPGDAQGGGEKNLLDGIAAEDGCADVDAGLDPDTATALDNVAIA